MKMQYTEEQIARANHTDLVSFLNEQGEQLVKSGREYRWKKHDSVTISGNRWYRHSQSKGGYPVDFVMEFYYATFPEAVKILIGEEGEGRQKSCPAPSKDFRLPEKNEDNEMIVKYLTESRKHCWKIGLTEVIFTKKRSIIMLYLSAEMQMVFRDMHTAGELVK